RREPNPAPIAALARAALSGRGESGRSAGPISGFRSCRTNSGDAGRDPGTEVIAQRRATTRGTPRIDHERLDDAQHVLDEFVQAGPVESGAFPVDGETVEDGAAEGERGIGSDRDGKGSGPAGREQQAQV